MTTSKNYTSFSLGKLDESLMQHKIPIPGTDKQVSGKIFLADKIALSGMEISVNSMPAGGALPFYHKHKKNEEVYLITSGSGEIEIDGDIIPLKEGDIINVKPDGVRKIRNTSDKPFNFVVIQAREGALEGVFGGGDGVKVDG